MNKVIGVLVISSFLYGCQTTSGGKRLILPPVSLDKGEAFLCGSGKYSYFLAKNKVLKSDIKGKEHDQMGVIVDIKKESMKDHSINYQIRFATREIFESGVVPEYAYNIDYISFNTEKVGELMSSGTYLTHMISFPSVPTNKTLNIRKKAYCKIQSNGYELMSNAEKTLGFNDLEKF